jgi:hypothetical protein
MATVTKAGGVDIFRAIEVKRPAVDPLGSSVLDHYPAVESTSFGLRNDEGLWVSYDSIVPETPIPFADFCAGVFTPIFHNGTWITAETFAVQLGAECMNVGLDHDDMVEEVKRVFDSNAGSAVEQYLLAHRFTAGDVVEVTGAGTPVSLQAAVAFLEGYMAMHYVGKPTIHLPRMSASLLGLRVKWIDGKAYTPSGCRIVCGGGYDTSAEFTGAYPIFATGEVYTEKATDVDVSTYVIPGDGTSGMDNIFQTAAERLYRVAVQGPVAKVNVEATGSTFTDGVAS